MRVRVPPFDKMLIYSPYISAHFQVAGLGLSSDTSGSRGDTRGGFGGRGEFKQVLCMYL